MDQQSFTAKRRVTRAQVAERAGTSPTTVAYVLNRTPGIKIREATRKRVFAAAKDLGYTPSFSARSMKRGRTELVGILTPSPAAQFHPFYARMLQGITDAAADSDYHFLHLTGNRREKYLRCLRQNYLDGVIVMQSEGNPEPLRDVLDCGLPVVSLNCTTPLEIPQISMDYDAAMAEALTTLRGRGARRILFVHGNWASQPTDRYLKVFRQEGERHRQEGLRFADLGIERYALDPEQITRLLHENWDALIVDGYELARDIAHHADFRERPDPVRMVVFSETDQPAPLGERVELLQSQPRETGALAWRTLLERLEGAPASGVHHRIAFTNLNPE